MAAFIEEAISAGTRIRKIELSEEIWEAFVGVCFRMVIYTHDGLVIFTSCVNLDKL
jgi:hypothetical protein